MFRNLAANLVLHERIETTDAKAKELRRIAERLITKALAPGRRPHGDLAKLKRRGAQPRGRAPPARAARWSRASCRATWRKHAARTARSKRSTSIYKLFDEIAPRYLERVKEGKGGGYTRIIKIGNRRGDNAPISIIEFV